MDKIFQIILIFGAFGLSCFGARRYEFGETCSPSEDWCNYGKWMWCRNSRCECLHPNRQIYDEARDRCVGLIGTECNVYIGERECVTGSSCQFSENNGKSLCQCQPGFLLTSGGTRCKWDGFSKQRPFIETTTRGFDYSQFNIIRNRPKNQQQYYEGINFNSISGSRSRSRGQNQNGNNYQNQQQYDDDGASPYEGGFVGWREFFRRLSFFG